MKIARVLVLMMGILMIGMPGVSNAKENAEECERLWRNIATRADPSSEEDLVKTLKEWKTLEPKCRGTGIYEIHLASTYAMVGDYQHARLALQDIKVPDRYAAMAQETKFNIDFFEALSAKTPDLHALNLLEPRLVEFLRLNPGAEKLYGMLGHVRILLSKYAAAIGPLEKVVNSGNAGIGDYRNLTIAYANSGRYADALKALDATYAMSKDVLSDEEFMFAAVKAYAAAGNVSAAKNALTVILNRKPYLQNDARFIKTVDDAKILSKGKLE